MNTAQIIVLTVLIIGIFIGYFNSMITKDESKKFAWGFFQLIFTGFLFVIAFVMTEEREEALKQLKGKCPEYEKIENVYKLKK
jgi:hypothetical protein